jgi:hypothetical protein
MLRDGRACGVAGDGDSGVSRARNLNRKETDMAAAAKLDLVPEAGTDIVIAVTSDPGIVLIDHEKYSVWYEARLAEGKAIPSDVTVKKNRDALRSFAADVRSEKAGIKKARLRLTEEARTMVNNINAAGKEIDEQLESLAVDIRKPLTDWEEAEDARVDECNLIIANLKEAATIAWADNAGTVRDRGASVWSIALDPEKFGEQLEHAQHVKAETVATLKLALARLTKEEADRAELERLRADALEREAEQARTAAAQEAARQEAEELRLYQERRDAAEQAEAQRIADAEKAAAEKAQREAEERHAAELAAEREKLAAVERDAQAERDRVALAEQQRLAKEEADRLAAQKIADELARLEKDKANRARVKTAAKQAIMTCGADEETAQKIVLAIIAREIPNVTIGFGQ